MPTCTRAHELDVVRLTGKVDRWAAGTEGTVVGEHSEYLLVEIDGPGGVPRIIDVPRDRAKVIWRAKGAQLA